MVNRQTLVHLRSGDIENGGPKMPAPDKLLLGEIAINFSPGKEKLFIKNSNNEIKSFCTEEDTMATEGVLTKMISDNKTLIDDISAKLSFYEGSNIVNSLSAVPITKKLVIATVQANQTFSLNGIPENGKEIHIFITNTDIASITVALPTNSPYKTLSNNALTIDSNETKEINAISDGKIIYIRAL